MVLVVATSRRTPDGRNAWGYEQSHARSVSLLTDLRVSGPVYFRVEGGHSPPSDGLGRTS